MRIIAPLTKGQQLIALLEAYGVDTVFGIPGVHTLELSRGLAPSKIKHIAPRHEQGAAMRLATRAPPYPRTMGQHNPFS